MITNPTDDQAAIGLPVPPPTNPLVDEIDQAHARLSPDAQGAIQRAHELVGLTGIKPPPDREPLDHQILTTPQGGFGPPAADWLDHSIATPETAKSLILRNASQGGSSAEPVNGIKPPPMDSPISAPAGAAMVPVARGIKNPAEGDSGSFGIRSLHRDIDPGIDGSTGRGATPRLIGSDPGIDLTGGGPDGRNDPGFSALQNRAVSPQGLTPPAVKGPSDAVAEQKRVHDTGSGISQIKSPWARVPLQILDAIGSGLFPKIAMGIPGTEAHHELVENRAERQVGAEESQQAAEDKSRLAGAQATEQESLPELHKTQAELAASKIANAKTVSDAKQGTADANQATKEADLERKRGDSEAKIDAHLRDTGFMRDKDGNVVAVPYEQLSQKQRDAHDTADSIQTLKTAQADLAAANQAYAEAKSKNLPQQMELARKKAENASHTASIAQERLGLSERTFDARYHGTEGGAALPGAMIGDDGKPIGTAFQQNVRPTGQERNKADLASSAHDQLADIKSIVAKRPDIFGPIAGRKTDFDVWLGSQDPDAQRFKAARTIAGDHLAGVFGGRSEAALKALDSAIGEFKTNPHAVAAGIDQLDKANTRFVTSGTVKTAGSNAAHTSPDAHPDVKSQADFDALPKGAVFMENGKQYRKP